MGQGLDAGVPENDFMTKLKRALAPVALLAAAAIAFAAWRVAAGPSVEAERVRRSDLLQTVVASGRVESPRRVEIGSAVVGTVVAVPVAEGARVAAGELLVALDESEARAAVAQARTALAQAEARLAQIRSTSLPMAAEAVRQAQATLVSAEASLGRSRDLFARGFVGQAALDEAQRARDVAASQLASARLQHEGASAGGGDERVALAGVANSRAGLAVAEARLAFMTIEAPVAGVLIARAVERGAVVQPGKALMVLSPAGTTELVVALDEKSLALVRVGQKALASADAFPGARFEAQVSYIHPAVDPLRGTVEVKLTVPDPPAYLLQDMTVSVDIEVARLAGVLAVPAEAIHDGGWVIVARDGRARRQAVKVGARGSGMVEVAQGLAEGDLVLAATGTGMHVADGDAVRVRERPGARPPRT